MKKLEARVKHTENALGNKLQHLDKDRDGVLDSDELRDAITKMLKKKDLSPLEAQEFVKSLDQDNDGKGIFVNFFLTFFLLLYSHKTYSDSSRIKKIC